VWELRLLSLSLPNETLRTEFFPKAPYVARRTAIKCGEVETFGPWTVTTCQVPIEDQAAERVGEKRGLSSANVEESSEEPSSRPTLEFSKVTLTDVLSGEASLLARVNFVLENSHPKATPNCRSQINRTYSNLCRKPRFFLPKVSFCPGDSL